MSHTTSQEYDPITLEILWSRLIAIVDEAAVALVRTSFSTIVRESNDYACILMDAQGNSLAENTLSIPVFIGTMPRTMKHFLAKYPPGQWQRGDVAMTNDPWMATGHLHDITVAAPVFYRGKLVAFTGSVAHSPDVGGSMWAADARELFEEGLRLLPCKFIKAGQPNEELIDIIRANVRVPEQVLGDLYAQVAAVELCRDRLVEWMEEQGIEDLAPLGQTIQARAEQAMRRAIEEVPDGVYTHTVETDGFDEPLRLQIKLTVQGSEIAVDYAGTSPQIDRGLNSVMNYTYAYTVYPLKCVLDPHSPRNEGSYRPITVYAPEGTVLNPRFPAPVDARQLTGHFLSAAVFGALAKALPHRVIADSGGPPTRLVTGGIGHYGQRFSQILFPWGGMGARCDADGLPATPFPSNSGCGAMEVIEAVSPLIIWQKQLMRDSGGVGQYRGGCGQEIVVQIASEHPIAVSILSERIKHPPQGLLGGGPGAPAAVILNNGEYIHPKSRTRLKPGDVLTLRYPGGGGYGPPEKREREHILADLRDDLISPEAAQLLYRLDEKAKAPPGAACPSG